MDLSTSALTSPAARAAAGFVTAPIEDSDIMSEPERFQAHLHSSDGTGVPGVQRCLTRVEAAEAAGRTRRTIERWIASGRLPELRFGESRVSRIETAELLRALNPGNAERPATSRALKPNRDDLPPHAKS
jgi:excisionase family DNA binding protein